MKKLNEAKFAMRRANLNPERPGKHPSTTN
jgi:hypothetical protein